MATERLFFKDAYIKSFTARVIKQIPYDNKTALILDRTAFYAESGGQPADSGWINGVFVTHVAEENDEILHIIETVSEFPANGEVTCSIDWEKRFDHMQQHTGQHILSACFEEQLGGSTNSFHLGKEIVSIEINITDFDDEKALKIEDMSNKIIYDNLPLTTYITDADALKKLPLRNQPKVDDNIRIVQIGNFDYAPCGGTHVNATGEIGMIKMKRWEKNKDCYRIEFVCGGRALKDYQFKNKLTNSLGAKLSVRESEIDRFFDKLTSDYYSLQKQYTNIRQQLLKYETEKLIKESISLKNLHIISTVTTDKDINDLKYMAQQIVLLPSHIALLACINNENAQVIFSRAEDVNVDMGQLLKAVNPIISGKGGGSPKSAQGGGTNTNGLTEFLNTALNTIEKLSDSK